MIIGESNTLDTVRWLRQLLEKATPLPWWSRRKDGGSPEYEFVANGLIVGGFFEVDGEPIDQEADVELIQDGLRALPGLLDAYERGAKLERVAAAARHVGWNDREGKCWCPDPIELTGREHDSFCREMREALAALDKAGPS